MGAACRLFGIVLMLASTPVAAAPAIDALIAAFPDFVAGCRRQLPHLGERDAHVDLRWASS
jgi:hypothetical protein